MRRELHWLPVADRVKFKIATLVWKATTGTSPDYIAELCLPVGTQTGAFWLNWLAGSPVCLAK